jgi:cytochrome c-type biogenesis protein CcmE
MRLRWSFIIAGVAIAGAILYLVLANTGKSAQYYMTVSELRACTSCGAQTVRVAGVVAADGLIRDDAHQIIHFVVKDSGGTLPVEYGGVVPDVFKPGVQVVVEGHLTNGLFKASSLLAKCPSKFQSATPSAG